MLTTQRPFTTQVLQANQAPSNVDEVMPTAVLARVQGR